MILGEYTSFERAIFMKKSKKYSKIRLTIRISNDLIMRVKAQALLEHKNTSQYVEHILDKRVPKVIEIRADIRKF